MVGQQSMARGIFLLVLAQGLAGCGGARSSWAPSAPSVVPQLAPPPAPQPTPIQLAVFTDPASGFSTSDVRDIQEQIVRFNTANELIWTADGTRLPEYLVDGNFIAFHHRADRFFQVRFGLRDGERRAYLTWTDDVGHFGPHAATILDLEVVGGQLVITGTNVPVPGT
jgi:hypothetical protein